MIDLHAHVLPGVDDGPDSAREAARMCRMAGEQGCDVLVATPHQRHPGWWNSDTARLQAALDEVRAELGPYPRLLLGAEIRVDSGLLNDLERMAESGILPLAGTSYLLLEFGRQETGAERGELIHEIRLAGWRPIVAHPEFIPGLDSPPATRRLVEAGGLMQVTAGSLTGRFGRQPLRVSRELVDQGVVHFVASDAHSADWRPPDLGEAYEMIAARWGDQAATRLCLENPRAVIEDRPFS